MFDSPALAFMRTVQEAHMQDTGYRLVYSRTYNEVHESVDTWTASPTATACGIEMRSGSEKNRDDMTLIQYDAILRLPITTTIDFKDRFRLTKMYGESIAPIDYEIVSPIQRGPSGIRLLLKKVQA
jgi:hypothetical protein